jgi:hypothetical protein
VQDDFWSTVDETLEYQANIRLCVINIPSILIDFHYESGRVASSAVSGPLIGDVESALVRE